ncbi:hypothetical protein FA13DRAFT_1707097 [Coprinellus micaceus]|uniref:C2H2-type domain-containing protein n=1 Tax=Coprinellus micaceus TaxID=71717 RepID=A0A4Y7TMV0_COPMI|nr:hypothetical protein FA13DRAFT_1707097 [Coprinellus micaceus]
MYTCCPACHKTFSKKPTLNTHQNSCQPYSVYQSEALRRRTEASTSQPGALPASPGLKSAHRSWRGSETRKWSTQPNLRRPAMMGEPSGSGKPSDSHQPPVTLNSDANTQSSPLSPPTSDVPMTDDFDVPVSDSDFPWPEQTTAALHQPEPMAEPPYLPSGFVFHHRSVTACQSMYLRSTLRRHLPRVILYVRDRLTTAKSSISLWREYLHRPTFDPDPFVAPADLAKSASAHTALCGKVAEAQKEASQLEENFSWSSLLEWQATGRELKSDGELDRLVNPLPYTPQVKLPDLVGFSAQKAGRQSDNMEVEAKSPLLNDFLEAEGKVVAAIMLWSDSTRLANFGTAKLWPVYMFLGNLSKILLSDEEFLHTYKYGIVIKCIDGIERRVFPRILTYSAEYPEKQGSSRNYSRQRAVRVPAVPYP